MTVKPRNRPVVRDHRSQSNVRDHRSEKREVRDHRSERREVRDHRSERREVRDHRSEGRHGLRDLIDRFLHRRHESSYEERPVVRDHRRQPRLDGEYRQPYRPVEQYIGYTGPYSGNGNLDSPLPSYRPGQYPNVGDPGFTPPAYGGPTQYPNVGDSGFTPPVYGPELPPNGGAPTTDTEAALLDAVRKEGPMTGEQFLNNIRDYAGQIPAGDHLTVMQNLAQKHPEVYSPEARTCLGIFEKYAKTAGPDGMISKPNLDKMYAEMNSVKDASMYHALGGLDSTKGPISGAQMGDAILRGCSDTDGKGNSTELAQVKQWAHDNAGRLSPAAKMAVDAYVKIAEASAARGAAGLTGGEMAKVRIGMRNAALADDLQ